MLEESGDTIEALGTLVDQNGLLVAFLALLMDEAGVPMPVPNYFWPLLLGYQARRGLIVWWQALVLMELAAVVGATFLYSMATWAGRRLVYRNAHRVRVSPATLDHAAAWLRRGGTRAVLLGRITPGLRLATPIACGIFAVPVRVFVPAVAVGTLAYVGPLMLLGYYFGTEVLALAQVHRGTITVVGWTVALAGMFALIVWARRALHPAVDIRPTP